ncbi:dihydropteroate synthase [Lasius niger]|uniref:Dihydropteroate synthase n=1 Tax=Lasius niger TaxID=67767 RepID=A0A0J7KQQ7_LASNI|nr:dihydropteroate synthase [Lasius niger]
MSLFLVFPEHPRITALLLPAAPKTPNTEPLPLDSGSFSFISPATAGLAKRHGYPLHPVDKQINLANGAPVTIERIVTLPLITAGHTIQHRFQVLPNLGSPVLIGIDLRAKLRLNLPPPPPLAATATCSAVGEISGGITPQTPDEDRRLRQFLARELAAFDTILSPTDRIVHHIRLTTDQSIKQRY